MIWSVIFEKFINLSYCFSLDHTQSFMLSLKVSSEFGAKSGEFDKT